MKLCHSARTSPTEWLEAIYHMIIATAVSLSLVSWISRR